MSAAFIGLDLAKSVFQVHGINVHGKVVVTKRLRRKPATKAPTRGKRVLTAHSGR